MVLLSGAILCFALLRNSTPEAPRASAFPVPEPPESFHAVSAQTSARDVVTTGPRRTSPEIAEAPDVAGLRCRLMDAGSGRPIPRARGVFIIRSEKMLASESKDSDSSGWVTLKGQEPSLYSLQARIEGYVPQQKAALLTLSAITEVTFNLERGEELLGDVLDASGAAITVSEVRAFVALASAPENARAVTHGDGSFRFQGLRPGTWTVVAQAEGYRTASRVAKVPATDRLRMELSKDPGFSVLITDDTGAPLEDVRVAVRHPTHGIRALAASSFTDRDGKARLHGLPENTADLIGLEAKKKGFLDWGQPVAPTELEAKPFHIVLSRGSNVSGRVVDESSEGVAGAEVTLLDPDEAKPQRIKTNSRGEFHIRNVTPKVYTIFACTAEKGSSDSTLIEPGSDNTTEDLTLILKAGTGVIAGRVVDQDGRAIPLVPVTLSTGSPPRQGLLRTVTNEDGRFHFAGLVPENVGVRRTVMVGGGRTARSVREVSLGEENVELVTAKLSTLTGFVTGDSAPVAFEVHLHMEAAEKGADRVFRFGSSSHWFKIEGVEPGRYRLSVVAQGEVLATVDGLQVLPGENIGPIALRAYSSGRFVDPRPGERPRGKERGRRSIRSKRRIGATQHRGPAAGQGQNGLLGQGPAAR